MGKGKKGKNSSQPPAGTGGQGGQPPERGPQPHGARPGQSPPRGPQPQGAPPGQSPQKGPQLQGAQGAPFPQNVQPQKNVWNQQGEAPVQKPSSHSGMQPSSIQGAVQGGPRGPGGPFPPRGPPQQGAPFFQSQQPGGPRQRLPFQPGAPGPSGQPQQRFEGAPQPQKAQGQPHQPQNKGPQGAPQPQKAQGQPQQKGSQGGQPQDKGPQGAPQPQKAQGQPQQKGSQGGQPQNKGPQGAPQPQKAQGQPQNKGPQGAPQPQKAQGQPQQKGSQGGQPQNKGPQGNQPQQKGPQGGQPTPQLGGNQPKKETGGQQAAKEQAMDKENQPPKQPDQKPAQPSKSEDQKPAQQQSGALIPIPPRIKPGFSGRQTFVEVNQLPLNLSEICPVIFHYDLIIEPGKPKRLLRDVVSAFAKKYFPRFNPAFDGKRNLYSAALLEFGTHLRGDVVVKNPERTSNNDIEFTVEIKQVQKIETNAIDRYLRGIQGQEFPMVAIQAIDIILRAAPLRNVCVPVGRNYFLPPDRRGRVVSLGGGLELWHGFYQSAVLNWRPFLNIDVAHKGFPKPNQLTEILKELCNLRDEDLNRPLSDAMVKKFRGFVTTLKLDYLDPKSGDKRTHRINGLGDSAAKLIFKPNEDTAPMSVVEYFRVKKEYKIKYPNVLTVQVDPLDKKIFLPIELCYLKSGQALNRKLDEFQTGVMVKQAAQAPEFRKKKILDAINRAKYNSSPVVREFGIKVNENMEKVPARVLDAPTVQYKNDPNTPTGRGAWRAKKFLGAKDLKTWFILDLDYTSRNKIDNFVKLLIEGGSALGMNISKYTDLKQLDVERRQEIKNNITKTFDEWKKLKAELVIVVMPEPKYGDFYSMIKQCAELSVGILTQCVKSNTMFRMNAATCGNLLLKINSKINGTNHLLSESIRPSILNEPVMILGMDVTHPSPDRTGIPSIAAVAASHDPRAFQYNMIWSLQDPKKEIIVDLKNIVKKQLVFFFQKTRQKPLKIIVFRDGVSEGYFQEVLKIELTAIRDACREMPGGSYRPGITFLVVQKRHHVRFFPMKEEDEDGRNKNVLPGTIIDTQITHPRELDFYLVSHASLQGTSRPTKYHRLWDDNKISENDLEVLTYYLCYLFSRCTRSVSYPAPTYYAHLAAFRARAYLEDNPARLDNLQDYAERNQIKQDFMMNSPMFFV